MSDTNTSGHWEIDRRPEPRFNETSNGSRALLITIANQETCMIMNMRVIIEGGKEDVASVLRETIKTHGMTPRVLLIKDENLLKTLEPLALDIGCDLKVVKRFKEIPKVMREREQFMRMDLPDLMPDLEGDSEDRLFSDCAICRAHKDALQDGRVLTERELVEAFKQVEHDGQFRDEQLEEKTRSDHVFLKSFGTILYGNREASREAARGVRQHMYASGRSWSDGDIHTLIALSPCIYQTIKEDWRRENFVRAISSMYFLRSSDERPDFLFSWLFDLLTHKNGNIRYAVVHMLRHEIGPLTAHIRFPDDSTQRLIRTEPQTADFILGAMFVTLNDFLRHTWEERFQKYKYISNLPTSPYKSAQMIMMDLVECCGERYMVELKKELGFYDE